MAVNPEVPVLPTELNDIVSNTCILRNLIKQKTKKQEHQTKPFLTEKGANRFFTRGKMGTYNPKVSLDITHLSNGFEWGGFLSNPRTELFPKGLPEGNSLFDERATVTPTERSPLDKHFVTTADIY